MSIFDTILSGTRNMMLLQYKVEQLITDVNRLNTRQETLTERIIRLEVVIAEAQRAAAARPPALPRNDA